LRDSPAAAVAAERVAALRRWLGRSTPPPLSVVGCAEHAKLANELARRSITRVRDDAGLLPLRPSGTSRLLVLSPTPTDLTPADTSSTVVLELLDAARRRHARTETFTVSIDPSADEIESARGAVLAADLVILCTIDAFRHEGQEELARVIEQQGRPIVLVALRMPSDADLLDDLPTALACYSIHRPSTDAVAAVIFGEIEAAGRMPLTEVARSHHRPPGAVLVPHREEWP
jgi:beta-N-acetylhexosaminidase